MILWISNVICVNDQAAHFFLSNIQTQACEQSRFYLTQNVQLYWQSDAALRRAPASDGTPQLSDLQSRSLPAYCCPGFSFFQSFTWMPADAGLSHQRTNIACITNSLFSPAKSKHWILLGSLSTIQFYADRPFNLVLAEFWSLSTTIPMTSVFVIERKLIRCSTLGSSLVCCNIRLQPTFFDKWVKNDLFFWPQSGF